MCFIKIKRICDTNMKNEAIQETSKMYLFCWTSQRICESKIQRIKPYNWPDGPPAGDRLGKIAEAVRWLCFCVKYEKGKSENEANHQSSVKRAARGLCLCIENMSTAAEGLCHSIGIQKSQADNEMKRKEIFKKGGWGAALSFIWSQIWQKSSVKKEKQERRTHKGSQKVQWIYALGK